MNKEKLDKNELIIKEYKDKIFKLETENNGLKSTKEKSDKNHKRMIIIISSISVILFFVTYLAIPCIVHGNTQIIAGDDDFILESPGTTHFCRLALHNNGWGQSKDVKLHISFNDGVEILTDDINDTVFRKNTNFEMISNNECIYQWDYLNADEYVNMEIHIKVDSSLGIYIPADISVSEDRS